MDPTKLYQAASAVLTAVVDAYSADETATPLPARQYVADGQPAWDLCADGQLTVYLANTRAGMPGLDQSTQPLTCFAPRVATLWVEVARCVPTVTDSGKAPTAEAIDASAQVLMEDPVRFANAITEAYRAGNLGSKWGLIVGDWEQLGPAGGLGGGRLQVQLGLMGQF